MIGPTTIIENGAAALDAVASDPDGDNITGYAWDIISGTGSISQATGTQTVFTPDGAGDTIIECAVTDDGSPPATGRVRTAITVTPITPIPPNEPPVVMIIGPTTIIENGAAALDAVAADPDGDNITGYAWDIISGTGSISQATGTQTVFTPDGAGDTIIECAVTDDGSPPATGRVRTTITVTPITTSLSVTWVDPSDNGCDITDYDLRYHNGDGNWRMWAETETTWLPISPDPEGYIATLERLEPDTEYHIQVRAENSSGNGKWSNSGLGRTAQTNQPPTLTLTADPTVIARSGSNNLPMQSTITATAIDPEGDDLTYVFTVLDKDDMDIGDMGIRNTKPPSDNMRIFSPPSGDNTDYRIRCTVSDMQTPPNSALDTAPVRVIDVPSKPATPTCNAHVAQTVRVRWIAPNDNNSIISDYDLQFKQSRLGDLAWDMVENLDDFTDLTTLVDDLDETQLYDFQVRAENEAGESEWSETIQCRPGVPNQCPIINSYLANFAIHGDTTASRGENLFLTINASDPDNDPLSYSFEVVSIDGNPPPSMDQGWQFLPSPFGFPIDTLFTPNEPGVYVVRASVSDGDTDCDVFQDKTITVANQPPIVRVEVIETSLHIGGTTKVNAIISDPEGDPTTVLWQVFDSNGMPTTTGGTFSEDTLINTQYFAPTMNSQAGTYTIRATATDVPYGATTSASVDIEVTIEILPPGKVPIVSVERTANLHDELRVSWNQPLDDGGSPVTEYEIGYRPTDGMDQIDIAIPIEGVRRSADDLEDWSVTGREIYLVIMSTTYPVSIDIDGLSEGTQYDFRVRAKSSGNTEYGEWSDVITQETSTELTVNITARNTSVNKGVSVLITALASRTDNIEYAFTAPNGGEFAVFNTPNIGDWTSPDKSTIFQSQNGVPDAYEIIVVVTDTMDTTDTTDDDEARDSIQIVVLNRAPTIDLFQSPGLSFSTLTPNVVSASSELVFTVRVSDPDTVDASNLVVEWSINAGSGVVTDQIGLEYTWTLPPTR